MSLKEVCKCGHDKISHYLVKKPHHQSDSVVSKYKEVRENCLAMFCECQRYSIAPE
jgi:hypothetical protein